MTTKDVLHECYAFTKGKTEYYSILDFEKKIALIDDFIPCEITPYYVMENGGTYEMYEADLRMYIEDSATDVYVQQMLNLPPPTMADDLVNLHRHRIIKIKPDSIIVMRNAVQEYITYLYGYIERNYTTFLTKHFGEISREHLHFDSFFYDN